jgi:hypothetical protein
MGWMGCVQMMFAKGGDVDLGLLGMMLGGLLTF